MGCACFHDTNLGVDTEHANPAKCPLCSQYSLIIDNFDDLNKFVLKCKCGYTQNETLSNYVNTMRHLKPMLSYIENIKCLLLLSNYNDTGSFLY